MIDREADFWCRLLGKALDCLDECAGDDEEGWNRQEHAHNSAAAIRAQYENRPLTALASREGAQAGEREFAYVEGPKGLVRFDLGSKATPPAPSAQAGEVDGAKDLPEAMMNAGYEVIQSKAVHLIMAGFCLGHAAEIYEAMERVRIAHTPPAPGDAVLAALRAERADLAGHMHVLRHHCLWLPDIDYREDIREVAQTLVDKTLERVCNRILRENKRQDWEAKRARKGGAA
ncbi:hypothetical protein [Labrys sp. ZIDIC5]|uniref:hypothetical protein n=1 Tax=Labrys sedimenti TaxID=3106036 RepID=UPI002ACAB19F|nr:hypothetical protein [Labrys sp. ZIDIC5]MDZ5448924.1 hypothetical protein [Labrys sp. ZIDIC5]